MRSYIALDKYCFLRTSTFWNIAEEEVEFALLCDQSVFAAFLLQTVVAFGTLQSQTSPFLPLFSAQEICMTFLLGIDQPISNTLLPP